MRSSNESTKKEREYDIILIAPNCNTHVDLSHLESLPLKIAIYSETRWMTMLTTIYHNEVQKIADLCLKTRILMNLEAKDINYISELIDGCIAAQTDYVDDCNDISILKRIFLLYNEKAHASMIRIIQGCVLEAFLVDVGIRILEEAYEVKSAKLSISAEDTGSEISHSSIQSKIAKMRHFIEFTVNQSRYLLKRDKIKTSTFEMSVENDQIFGKSIFKQSILRQAYKYIMDAIWIDSSKPSIYSDDMENKIILKGLLSKAERSILMVITADEFMKSSHLFCMSEVGLAMISGGPSCGVLTAVTATRKSKIIDRVVSKGIKFDCHTVK